jgi:hypothetical protein
MGFPAVSHPALVHEPPDDDDDRRERDHGGPALGAPDEFLVGVGPGGRALDHPAFSCGDACGTSLPGDLGVESTRGQQGARADSIVAAIEMDGHRRVRHRHRRLRRVEEQGIVPVGRSGDDHLWDSRRIDRYRAFESLCAAVAGKASGHLAAARGRGDAAVDAQIREVQADHAIIRADHEAEQRVHHAGSDSRIPAATQGGGRNRRVGNALRGTPKDEDLHERVERDPVRNPRW